MDRHRTSFILAKEVRHIMAHYHCSDDSCDMEIMEVNCGKCSSELVYNTLTRPDGSTVGVLECPKGCGRIKSPMCHGQDMAVV